MSEFLVCYTGDYLDAAGQLTIPDIATDLYATSPQIRFDFLRDQSPQPGQHDYWDRLYSLEIEPAHMAQADGIVIFRPWVTKASFAHGAQRLAAIGRAGAGYDKIDLDACTANDVVVFNAPDTLTHSTASAALLLMLALAKRLAAQQEIVRTGRWDLQPQTMGDDLVGRTLGIIGLGATGRELARLVAPFQMQIIAYSPRADQKTAAAVQVELVPTLDEVLKRSDYVSLHCRLEPHTRRMLGAEQLRKLQPTAYLINVARGELIDQPVLVQALRERWFAGAGLDVFEHEPLPADDPLTQLDNVILTPHWLPSTRRAGRLTTETMARGMLAIASGQLPENIVNPDVIKRADFQRKLARFGKC
jgi:phosphoglycerate dehydrogenase-like enzyme